MSYKRPRNDDDDDEPGWQIEENSGNQILPVAILPADFDGIPLDGSQYLAVVRKEAKAAPSIARYKGYSLKEAAFESVDLGIEDDNLLPPPEWRDNFLHKFRNMRESLMYRVQSGHQSQEGLPKGKSAKKWFKYLHGLEPRIDEFSEDEEELVEKDGKINQANSDLKGENPRLRPPKDSLLRTFQTVSELILRRLVKMLSNTDCFPFHTLLVTHHEPFTQFYHLAGRGLVQAKRRAGTIFTTSNRNFSFSMAFRASGSLRRTFSGGRCKRLASISTFMHTSHFTLEKCPYDQNRRLYRHGERTRLLDHHLCNRGRMGSI